MFLLPTVLECMRFATSSRARASRTAIHYEFDLYLDGKRTTVLDGRTYADTEQCLIFRKPGQTVSGEGDYNMYALTLNFGTEATDERREYRPTFGTPCPLCDFAELNALPSVFKPYHFYELKELMKNLSLCSYPNAVDGKKQRQYIKEFLLLVLYDATKHVNERSGGQTLNSHVKNACDYVARHFKENLSVADLADRLHVTENHLIKLFKRELGQTPNQYLLELRLVHAKYLLQQSDQTVQEVAFACGFNTPSYFSKRFLARFGTLPRDFHANSSR